MVGQPRHPHRDIVWVLRNLYASDIYVMLQTCDEGIRIWISDRLFKTRVDHSVSVSRKKHYHLMDSTAEAALWLHEQTLRLFPDSKYARQSFARGRGLASTQRGPHIRQVDRLQSSEYWQGRAEEAHRMADRMGDVTAKALMLDIANNYELMAERAAKSEARLD